MSCTPAPLWGLWAGPSGLQWDVGSPAAPTYPGGGLPSWGPLGCSHLFWNRPRSGLPGPAGCAGAAGVCSRGSPEPPRALPQTTGCGIPRSGVCRVAPGSPPYCPAPPPPPRLEPLDPCLLLGQPCPSCPLGPPGPSLRLVSTVRGTQPQPRLCAALPCPGPASCPDGPAGGLATPLLSRTPASRALTAFLCLLPSRAPGPCL